MLYPFSVDKLDGPAEEVEMDVLCVERTLFGGLLDSVVVGRLVLPGSFVIVVVNCSRGVVILSVILYFVSWDVGSLAEVDTVSVNVVCSVFGKSVTVVRNVK